MTARKGWAPLSAFRPRYALPDGSLHEVRTYDDLDMIERAWAEHAGNTVDPVDDAPPVAASADMSPEAVAARAEIKRRTAEALEYVRTYSGSWGLPLDIRSDRRFGSAHMTLTVRQADALLAGKARDELREDDRAAEAYAAWQARPEDRPAQGAPVSDGWYTVNDEPWKVQVAVNGSGHLYAKRLDVQDGAGRWEYVPGGMRTIAAQGRPMTTAEAQAFGRLYGVCAVCGRTLTDETSIAQGIGPVCAGKL